jgi:hypothetical protein
MGDRDVVAGRNRGIPVVVAAAVDAVVAVDG